MAVVDDLLDNEPGTTYVDVNDAILVDPVSRRLILPPTEMILGVEGDDEAERKYFRCPQRVGTEMNLSECKLYINYTNANGDVGRHEVEDMVCDGENCVFSWKLTADVTQKQGTVSFNLCVHLERDNTATRKWHTTPAVGTVLAGLKME